MPKGDLLEMDGCIEDALGGGQYSVRVSDDQMVRAKLSGKMRHNKIRVLPGDRVKVSVSPYDLTHGFIIFRERR